MMVYPQGWFSRADMREYRRLVRLIPEGGTLVEVGVWIGRSLCSVAHIVREKHLRVIAVDPFTKTSAIHHLPPKGGQLAAFKANLASFGVTPEIVQARSLEGAELVKNAHLVFLDAEHTYEAVRDDIRAWKPKAKMIGGHDYGFSSYPGVKQAVDEAFPNGVKVSGLVWSALA